MSPETTRRVFFPLDKDPPTTVTNSEFIGIRAVSTRVRKKTIADRKPLILVTIVKEGNNGSSVPFWLIELRWGDALSSLSSVEAAREKERKKEKIMGKKKNKIIITINYATRGNAKETYPCPVWIYNIFINRASAPARACTCKCVCVCGGGGRGELKIASSLLLDIITT